MGVGRLRMTATNAASFDFFAGEQLLVELCSGGFHRAATAASGLPQTMRRRPDRGSRTAHGPARKSPAVRVPNSAGVCAVTAANHPQVRLKAS